MRRLTHCITRSCVNVLILVLAVGVTSQVGSSALAATLVSQLTGSPTGVDAEPLHLSGSVPDLWPGHRTTLEVQVTNTSAAPLSVRTLDVKVGDAARACRADNLEVVGYARSSGGPEYVVAAGQTLVVPLAITMINKDTNQDGCQGLSFPLTYSATATPAA